jgi:phosphoenolpyruvate carboxykinase (ATP)
MGKIHLIVPQQYAKLAFDLNLNFIRITPETEAIYARSKHLPISDIWLICHPEWVNPSWQAWRNRVTPADTAQIARDPEPKRIMMVFDTAYSTSYLLGARYFGEVKKACLTMIWDAAIKADIGMPIHGSSKTLFTRTSPLPPASTEKTPSENAENTKKEAAEAPLKPTTFITIGLSGSGKSTLGNDAHQGFLDPALGERSRIGNDDALIILYQPNDPQHGTIGLEDSCYNKSNDYTPGSIYINTVQSAENVMCYRDEHGKLSIIHQDVLCGNGRVQTARHLLPGADHQLDTPSPDFIALLMKDETLPPILRITNPQLMVSMYMCLTTRSSSAENIPIAQMNQLRMVPGANPFNTWGMEREAEALEKLLQHIGCQGIVLNTGSFFINQELHLQGKHRKITKEISLAMYPLLARNKIRWEPWSFFPGTEIPAPGAFDELFPDFDAHFHPHRSQDEYAFREILRKRLLARLDFLLEIKIDRRFILPIRKAIYELDAYEQSTRGPIGHVDNLETLRGTGREDKLSF